nr:uncharacterized protein LOC127346671 [Lolium perenne]
MEAPSGVWTPRPGTEPATFGSKAGAPPPQTLALCRKLSNYQLVLNKEHRPLRWDLRFNIIKGVCDGLKYLHDAKIMHFDLKPASILLDEKMVPKIGGYGLSRLMGEVKTVGTMSYVGRLGYMPPEYIEKQVLSEKFDIYSLGMIIKKTVMGDMDYWKVWEMSERKLTEQVHYYWKRILEEIPSYPSVEEDCKQVLACIEIAILCTKNNRHERPSMEDIVYKLDMVDLKKNDSSSQIEKLSVNTLELCFPCNPKKAVHCSLQISNKGEDRVAFMLVANKSSKSYLAKLPLCGVVPPRCTYTHNLTMRKQSKPPSESVEFVTLQSVAVANHDLLCVGQGSVTVAYEEFFRKAEPAGYVVQELTLKAVCHTPAERSASKSTPSTIKIIATQNSQELSSIDLHPEEPLIVTTNHGGILRLWNYETMTTLNSIEVTDEPGMLVF